MLAPCIPGSDVVLPTSRSNQSQLSVSVITVVVSPSAELTFAMRWPSCLPEHLPEVPGPPGLKSMLPREGPRVPSRRTRSKVVAPAQGLL